MTDEYFIENNILLISDDEKGNINLFLKSLLLFFQGGEIEVSLIGLMIWSFPRSLFS